MKKEQDTATNQYDTSGTHWAIKQGIVTRKDLAVFYQSIADLAKRGYYIPKTYDGEYILESDNKMIFTNGDYHFPEISRVVVFNDMYESNIAEYKEWIIDEARNSSWIGESIELIKGIEGEEYDREYSKELYERDARETGEREGRNRGAALERTGSEEVKHDSKKDKPRRIVPTPEEAKALDERLKAREAEKAAQKRKERDAMIKRLVYTSPGFAPYRSAKDNLASMADQYGRIPQGTVPV